MTENAPEDIGALLKERREQRGFSLEDAAQHTRIRKTHLQSLESNQFSDLPGQVYVTGFIRVYANYLGLDGDSLLEKMEDVPTRTGHSSVKYVPVSKPQSRRSGRLSAGKSWGVFVFGLLGVLLIAGVIYFLPVLMPDNDQAALTANRVVPGQEPVPVPIDSTGQAAEQTTDQAAEQTTDQAAEQTTDQAADQAAEQPQTAPLPGPESSPAANVAEGSAEPPPLPPIPAAGGSLRMLALGEGTLTIYLDDRKAHAYKLYDGLDLTWKVRQNVLVEFAKPGVARFWLGSEELDIVDRESFQLLQDKRE